MIIVEVVRKSSLSVTKQTVLKLNIAFWVLLSEIYFLSAIYVRLKNDFHIKRLRAALILILQKSIGGS